MTGLSLFQRFMVRFFKWQYVILFLDGVGAHFKIARAYPLAKDWWAHPYLPDTRGKLLPKGKFIGPNYVKGWEPITAAVAMVYYLNYGEEEYGKPWEEHPARIFEGVPGSLPHPLKEIYEKEKEKLRKSFP